MEAPPITPPAPTRSDADEVLAWLGRRLRFESTLEAIRARHGEETAPRPSSVARRRRRILDTATMARPA